MEANKPSIECCDKEVFHDCISVPVTWENLKIFYKAVVLILNPCETKITPACDCWCHFHCLIYVLLQELQNDFLFVTETLIKYMLISMEPYSQSLMITNRQES